VEESGAFVELITPESFTRWLLASGPPLAIALSRLPAA
jgi:phage head maturation protease